MDSLHPNNPSFPALPTRAENVEVFIERQNTIIAYFRTMLHKIRSAIVPHPWLARAAVVFKGRNSIRMTVMSTGGSDDTPSQNTTAAFLNFAEVRVDAHCRRISGYI
ncbi:hypothetical protein FOXB_03175 [Fusarium oxysporum f. sp. conglutinans Fo5176]|uniref:Uncharacterized protein n=1 Tax=Fusarium oxysporum (strain Fo5176) TaxID=660025 RepID=F9F9V0_FUSOF|nr:hypothetical protein FOXB_03175 [Fusarium oxysporum f. sp. conglutinans Fo5176]